MMAKYRILQKSANNYVPQIKCWFFWESFGFMYTPSMSFDTKEGAKKFLDDYHAEHGNEKYPKVISQW